MSASRLRTSVLLFAFSFLFPYSSSSMTSGKDSLHIAALKTAVTPLMQMNLKDVIAEVPSYSGIHFIGCPNCKGGAQEMNVLMWKPGMGETVRCNFCNMVFPNEQFPNNRKKVIIAPSGARQVYPYYEDSQGKQYYFGPHAWFERWRWIQSMAGKLSELWFETKDNGYGDRAAAIAGRFAQVFPDYAVRYDYPNAAVKFFPADQKWPYNGLVPYRGAKWNWWGYGDIPMQIANTYTLLQNGYDWKRMDPLIGPETDQRIERDLLRMGYEFTAANTEVYSNMSPGMYRDMIQLGRILKDPDIVHDGVTRFREFLKLGFFADGWWKEGTASYHDQTIGGLRAAANAAKGYTDPVSWKGERFENLDLTSMIPFYKSALDVSTEAVLPNGRKIAINDTWAYDRRPLTISENSSSRLWPSLGNAALVSGIGKDQLMLNINWSGNYGHSHYDNASIILFAAGGELLSDIGYTHSKYRGWTIHTASHNTVLIDQKGQNAGTADKPVTGRLLFYDDKDPHVKTIDVDASPAYDIANTYRRRLVVVHAGPGRDYVIDRFDVKGGQTHDWFLHGMCEEEGKLETSIPLEKNIETLVPEWGGNNMPKTQYDTDLEGKRFHAYSYISNIKSGPASGLWTATWRYKSSGLRTHNLSEADTRVFRFSSPSVRMAAEDDNKLADYNRNGIMQRHIGGSSSFISIHEPFGEEPWIESVKNEKGQLIISYRLNGLMVEDRISLKDDKVEVLSGAGWAYQSGTPRSGEVQALENKDGIFRLKLDRKANGINYIRLDLTGGGTRYYPASPVDGNWLQLEKDPGFTIDAGGNVKFHTFPHDTYAGPLRYTLFEPVKAKF